LASRLLHRFALRQVAVLQTQFDIESMVRPVEPERDKPHVFIAGLARSGTTALTRAFHATGEFRSLTYRDMPFVLMPNLWGQLSKPFLKHRALAERAHGDGIRVDFDSPEAFEEVFWRAFCSRDYICHDRLQPHDITDTTVTRFRRYVNLVLASDTAGRRRYLSKNNNNILRLPAIKKAFPNAVIVVPFRDPLQQAISLQRQHERFLALHQVDRFSYSYMEWLGHHEFGATHKPFDFAGSSRISHRGDGPDSINYWLRAWYDTYQFLQHKAPTSALFLSYERLCHEGMNKCQTILQQAGVAVSEATPDYPFAMAEHRSVDGIDDDLLGRSAAIYEALCQRQQ